MSKIIEQFSKDLASGMSRRRAVGRFFTGIGVAAGVLLTRKKAFAGDAAVCVAFCAEQELQGRDFGACVAASANCPPGQCAFVANGGGFFCMPIR